MALATVTVHGQILAPDGLTPAVGYVRWRNLVELRDTVDNVVYAPDTWTATLDGSGQFTIVLPSTDNPDITPLDWSYQVFVATDVWRDTFFVQLPFSMATLEFADLIAVSTGDGSDCTPDGTACAPISVVAQVAALAQQITGLQVEVDVLTDDVADLTTLVNGFAGDITDLQTDVTTLQGQVVTLQGQVTTINGQITTLQGQVATNTTNISTLQGQMTAAQAAISTLQGQMTTVQGQITTLQGQVAANTAAIALKVSKSGDTMTGDLVISNAYLRQQKTVAAAGVIPAPLIEVDFTTVPLITDPNIFQVSVNGSPGNLSGWLNEVGHYRAEQRSNYLFDHNVTLIASFAAGTGRMIRFERRDAGNVRQITGGFTQDALLETQLYPFTTITNIDPGATGKYTAVVAGGIATISVRREFNDICRLQGRIAVTAAGTVSGDVIMVLPAAFIPNKARWMSVTSSGGAAIPCEVLNTSGNVVARRTQAGAANLAFDDFTFVTS